MYKHISKIINNGKRNSNVLNNIPELAHKPLTEIVEIINNQFATIYMLDISYLSKKPYE